MARCTDMVTVRVAPGDDIERAQIAETAEARQVRIIVLNPRILAEWTIQLAIYGARRCIRCAQVLHGSDLVCDTMGRTQRRIDGPRHAIGVLTRERKPDLWGGEFEHEFLEQQGRLRVLIDLAIPGL